MSLLTRALGGAAFVSFLAAGCASEPRPAEEMARAKTLVYEAEGAGAQRYAAADLDQARSKLQEADRAAGDKKYEVARKRANEAAADAELAMARARSGQAQQAAEQMERSVEMLRQEAARGIPVTEPDKAGPND